MTTSEVTTSPTGKIFGTTTKEHSKGSPLVTVIGNPQPNSRTVKLVSELAGALTEQLSLPQPTFIDLSNDPHLLIDHGYPVLKERLLALSHAELVLVASPIYKGSYTGLLKLFLDQLPSDLLKGKIAIPIMVGAAPAHSMAADIHLRPLLLELGASCPTASLVVIQNAENGSLTLPTPWLEQSVPLISRVLQR